MSTSGESTPGVSTLGMRDTGASVLRAAALRRPIPWVVGILLLGLAQTAVIGWSLWDRISILRAETEMVLTPRPVDPRDLFRGDYVILDYALSNPQGEVWPTIAVDDDAPPTGATIWVEARQTEEGGWVAASVSETRPDAVSDGAVLLQGRVAPGFRQIAYGLERYYVPEGEGLRLERMIGGGDEDARISVVVAVDRDGRAAIKALLIDGELAFEEPFY